MDAKEITGLVKDLGVPIAMLFWFAFRVERKLEAISLQLIEFTKSILTLVKDIGLIQQEVKEVTSKHIIPRELRELRGEKGELK